MGLKTCNLKEFSRRTEVKSCLWDGATCCIGAGWVGGSTAEQDPGFLGSSTLNMSRCVLLCLKANNVLGCVSWGVTSKLREVINSFVSALVKPHLDCPVLQPLPPVQEIVELEKSAVKSTKVVRGPGHHM